jgi:hypothetical protein
MPGGWKKRPPAASDLFTMKNGPNLLLVAFRLPAASTIGARVFTPFSNILALKAGCVSGKRG